MFWKKTVLVQRLKDQSHATNNYVSVIVRMVTVRPEEKGTSQSQRKHPNLQPLILLNYSNLSIQCWTRRIIW